MKVYTLEAVQNLSLSLDDAWTFFSNPANLREITPPDLDFAVRSELPACMYAGLIIRYSVRPLLGIPAQWVSEISHVRERSYFVDEQRIGPYRMWQHQHFFREVPGGVQVRDLVHYALPCGIMGRMLHPVFVRPQLEKIFTFRRARLAQLFGECTVVSAPAAATRNTEDVKK